MTTAWFDPSILVWAGPLAGASEAVWGGAIGVLTFTLAGKGRGRPIVLTHLFTGLVAAVALISAGLVAALGGQPMPIYATFLGLGAPLLIAGAFALHALLKVYRVTELRRMRAMDL